jgi:hypothetical protein
MKEYHMAAYKIVGKPHHRSTLIRQHVTYPDGSAGIVRQAGPMTQVPVGAILEDVTPGELAAFPDRFQAVTDSELEAYKHKQAETAEAYLGTPNPDDAEAKQQQRLKLREEILELQRQLAELGPETTTEALRERAPVDPVTQERMERDRELLRQAANEQTEQAEREAREAPEMVRTRPGARGTTPIPAAPVASTTPATPTTPAHTRTVADVARGEAEGTAGEGAGTTSTATPQGSRTEGRK